MLALQLTEGKVMGEYAEQQLPWKLRPPTPV